ncbi:receptor-type tyrosine-protein phosphatase eta-like [Phyllobates terribilis]|uniref:receptor-type tyrosine-protein phosphatase eta-like n=1 Tax=Phyllobates terribilis TaxID=111132 RepID=UPI003CCB6856
MTRAQSLKQQEDTNTRGSGLPPRWILSKTYDDFKNNLTDTYVTYIFEQELIMSSAQSNKMGVLVGVGSIIHSYFNGPLDPQLQYRVSIAGFNIIKYDLNTDTINEDQSLVYFTSYVDPFFLTTTTTNPYNTETKTTTSTTTDPYYTETTTSITDPYNTGTTTTTSTTTSPYYTEITTITDSYNTGTATTTAATDPYNTETTTTTTIADLYTTETTTITTSVADLYNTGTTTTGPYDTGTVTTTTTTDPYNTEATTTTRPDLYNSGTTPITTTITGPYDTGTVTATTTTDPYNTEATTTTRPDLYNSGTTPITTTITGPYDTGIVSTTTTTDPYNTETITTTTVADLYTTETTTTMTTIADLYNTVIATTDSYNTETAITIVDIYTTETTTTATTIADLYNTGTTTTTTSTDPYNTETTSIANSYNTMTTTTRLNESNTSVESGPFSTGRPNNNIQINLSVVSGSMDVVFSPFDSSNGPIVAYAIVVTTEMNGNHPPWGILSKTYNDFKNKLTNTYVTYIFKQEQILRTIQLSQISVHVGNGSKTHSYFNGPLDPQFQYRVSIAGFTGIRYDPNTDIIIEDQSLVSFTNYTGAISIANITTPPNSPSNPGTIAGAVIGSVVGIFAIIGAGLWFKRKSKCCKRNAKQSPERNENGVTASNAGGDERNCPTKKENYEKLFKTLQANNELGFVSEYDRLQPIGILQSRCVAAHPANKEKNREDAPYPYDKTRVTLSTLKNSSDGYINASYIPGYMSKKEFIAAQHPLPGTIEDFWYMIWEKRITTIVMLSNSLEDDYKAKGEEYWPKPEAKTFGNIIAAFLSETIHSRWTIRDFMLTNVKNNEIHRVRQFHFTEWHADCNVDAREMLIQFVYEVRQYKKENSSNCPTLVHCRTGTGRSGIFIALDCIINQLECTEKVDVYGTVHKMHLHRPLMVQTPDQYIFLHRCTLDIVIGKENVYTDDLKITNERSNEDYYNVGNFKRRESDESLYEMTITYK